MSIKKSLSVLALASAFAVAPGVAGAATYINFDGTTGSYGNDAPGNIIDFLDVFSFSVPTAGYLSVTLSSTMTPGDFSTNVNFAGNGQKLNGMKLDVVSSGLNEFRQLLYVPVMAGEQTLSIVGSSQIRGNYSGTLNFFAVPEPATWLLLGVGFGGLAFAMRRRRSRETVRVAYS